MTAKEYLKQVKLCDVKIKSKLDEIAKLKTLATKITTTLGSTVQSNSDPDKIGNIIAKIVDLENEINAAVDELVDTKRYITKTLGKLENPDELYVLHKRYIEYKTFEQIAYEMKFTYRNICYIHGRALNSFTKASKR